MRVFLFKLRRIRYFITSYTYRFQPISLKTFIFSILNMEGYQRELHIDSAKKVSTVPHEGNLVIPKIREEDNMQITSFVDTRFFTVEKWKVSGQDLKSLDPYNLISVLKGEGRINDMDVKKGDHLFLTALCHNPLLSGNLTLLTSWIDDSMERKQQFS